MEDVTVDINQSNILVFYNGKEILYWDQGDWHDPKMVPEIVRSVVEHVQHPQRYALAQEEAE